jgi:hypothetical protein
VTSGTIIGLGRSLSRVAEVPAALLARQRLLSEHDTCAHECPARMRYFAMAEFDRRIAANLEIVCRKLPGGGDHETRKWVAVELLEAAESGTNLRPSAVKRCRRQIADQPSPLRDKNGINRP